jgi:hypothetical protein
MHQHLLVLQESREPGWCCKSNVSLAQVTDVAKDTITIRSLDWDRDRFDIEFGYVSLALIWHCRNCSASKRLPLNIMREEAS